MKIKMLKPTTYKDTPRKIGDVLEVGDEVTASRWISRKIAEEVPVIPTMPEVAPTIVSEAFDLPAPKVSPNTKKEKKTWQS